MRAKSPAQSSPKQCSQLIEAIRGRNMDISSKFFFGTLWKSSEGENDNWCLLRQSASSAYSLCRCLQLLWFAIKRNQNQARVVPLGSFNSFVFVFRRIYQISISLQQFLDGLASLFDIFNYQYPRSVLGPGDHGPSQCSFLCNSGIADSKYVFSAPDHISRILVDIRLRDPSRSQ